MRPRIWQATTPGRRCLPNGDLSGGPRSARTALLRPRIWQATTPGRRCLPNDCPRIWQAAAPGRRPVPTRAFGRRHAHASTHEVGYQALLCVVPRVVDAQGFEQRSERHALNATDCRHVHASTRPQVHVGVPRLEFQLLRSGFTKLGRHAPQQSCVSVDYLLVQLLHVGAQPLQVGRWPGLTGPAASTLAGERQLANPIGGS